MAATACEVSGSMNILERIAQARDSDMIDIRTADGQIDAFPVKSLKDVMMLLSIVRLLAESDDLTLLGFANAAGMRSEVLILEQGRGFESPHPHMTLNRAKILATVPEGL